jgi:hypothetical protein
MRAMNERIRAGLACLAALLTPLSSVPHLACRCPDGHVKAICLGLAAKESGGCCCGGTNCCCCRTRGTTCARHGSQATCCGSHQAPSRQKSPPVDPSVADGPCCLKTLVAAGALAVARDPGKIGKHLQQPSNLAPPAAVVSVPPGVSIVWAPGLAHSPGPPANLIALLCRLVI